MDEQDKQDAVRRLLADARHDAPVPADVAARLDATLAGLVAERSAPAPSTSPAGAEVVDLAARRRRRRLGAFVAAAAAVVVAGVGVGQVLPTGSLQADQHSTAAQDGSADTSGSDARPDDLGEDLGKEPAMTEFRARASVVPVELSSDATDARVRRALRDSAAFAASADAEAGRDAPCQGDAPGRSVDVLWDGVEAVALWRPVGDADRIEITGCDGTVLRVVPLR